MRLYITIRTATKDLVIDYITVKLASGKVESINYDESNYEYEDGCVIEVSTLVRVRASRQ